MQFKVDPETSERRFSSNNLTPPEYEIRRIDCYSVFIHGGVSSVARVLQAMDESGIELLSVSAHANRDHEIEVDLVPADGPSFVAVATELGLKLAKKKTGFLLRRDQGAGGIAEALSRVADLQIISFQSIAFESNRYSAMLWVHTSDLHEAARALMVPETEIDRLDKLVDEASEESFPASDPPAY